MQRIEYEKIILWKLKLDVSMFNDFDFPMTEGGIGIPFYPFHLFGS